MTIQEFIEKDDYTIIQIAYEIINEVSNKLQKKQLFYKQQVENFVDIRINQFINSLNVKPAQKKIYATQIYGLINPRINRLFADYNLFNVL
ncbi:hypothetical protein [Bacillus solimangrovi]|uniref:Uncharacterized protein n=1 Tax=Bacillus solimangrovi TaxID=1305675 RepID=A0A1E5LF71_9BACI|nr:hypothetical protein [Bacillus solimangrovi]OEH92729.1 hypothetical protein BFG57_01620 [Bacillus solimangrovi]